MRYINSEYESVCPVCAYTQNKLLYKVSSREAANHFRVTGGLDKDQLDNIEDKIVKIWCSTEAAVIKCGNCGFGFASPFVAGDYEFYNLLPHATGEEKENWKWEFEKAYHKIKGITQTKKDFKLLEIGASTGDFIKRIAADLIPKESLFCLEYSQIGVDRIKKAGIEAHSWNFHELQGKEGFLNRFDIICLFQVLEHLDNLEETFQTFNTIIKPGGHLFIGVPNSEKITFNELHEALLDMPPNHIGRFNRKSFEKLATNYHWEIEETAIEPFSSLDVMKTVMYYRSLKRAQFPDVDETFWYNVKQYLEIKYIRLHAIFRHKQLGETLFVHLRKTS